MGHDYRNSHCRHTHKYETGGRHLSEAVRRLRGNSVRILRRPNLRQSSPRISHGTREEEWLRSYNRACLQVVPDVRKTSSGGMMRKAHPLFSWATGIALIIWIVAVINGR